MENKSTRETATGWCTDRYSVVSEVAEELKDHWLEIYTETELTEEQIVWKMLPIAISILSKHPDFTDTNADWEW